DLGAGGQRAAVAVDGVADRPRTVGVHGIPAQRHRALRAGALLVGARARARLTGGADGLERRRRQGAAGDEAVERRDRERVAQVVVEAGGGVVRDVRRVLAAGPLHAVADLGAALGL